MSNFNVPAPAGSTTAGTVACPTGEMLTGGGFQLIQRELVVEQSWAVGNAWSVIVFNPTGSPGTYKVSAQCATIVP